MRDETPQYVSLINNFANLKSLSITATGDTNIAAELAQIAAKMANSVTTFNLCVWTGGDEYLDAIAKFTSLEKLTLNGRSPMRHIDFKLPSDLRKLSPLSSLKQFRLILKNHGENILDNIGQHLPKLEVFEIVGLDLTDKAINNLAQLKSLSYLDIVAPNMTDAGNGKQDNCVDLFR